MLPDKYSSARKSIECANICVVGVRASARIRRYSKRLQNGAPVLPPTTTRHSIIIIMQIYAACSAVTDAGRVK